MNKIKITIVFLMAVVFAVACNQQPPKPNVANSPTNTANLSGTVPTASPSPVDEATLARNLYTTNCMICHKDSGKGGKTPVDAETIDPDDLTSDKMKANSAE